MFEVQCLDLHGNTINYFTQWDVDQKIIIPIDSLYLSDSGIPSSPNYAAPEVHFSNTKRNEAFVVRSTVIDKSTIEATVPNVLLQEPYPLLIYVYLTDIQNDMTPDSISQKTILHNEIPVRKRAKLSDYGYVENITPITKVEIKNEIEAEVSGTSTQAIQDITDTKDSAVSDVESAVTDFNTTSSGIIGDLNDIKSNSQSTYDDIVAKANGVQAEIETEINDMMLTNGLSIKPVDDGKGNVNIAIVIAQS